MQIHIIAVGQKLDDWINKGFNEYARRLPPECQIKLIEIAAGKRGKNADLERITREEGQRILNAIPDRSYVIAMEVQGQAWSTEELANQLDNWLHNGMDVALLIGGPEGLATECKARAQQKWSLSPLTLPHPLVRVVLAEQIYRAWSLLKGHPYHR